LRIEFVSYICKRKQEEKFELIATSDTETLRYQKNAKAVTTTPLAIPAIIFPRLNLKQFIYGLFIYVRISE
jgi:hypothetical protein